jgi:predicted ATPase
MVSTSTALCACRAGVHPGRRIAVTGGPGAGKTALLEVVRHHFCKHVVVLPEAAGIVFGGGFPRRDNLPARRAAQRAIYRIEVELERLNLEEGLSAVTLCDRGTLDGIAYWPGPAEDFFQDVGTSLDAELGRYTTVIHMRTPPAERGYNHDNPLRIESAREAARIDEVIADAWSRHPRRIIVESTAEFLDKIGRVIALLREEVPACCRVRQGPSRD